MKSRSGEKIKLTSIDELLGVVNEESAMEIEINRIHAFKGIARCPLQLQGKEELDIHIYSDRSNIELFSDEYRNNITCNIFSLDDDVNNMITAYGGQVKLDKVETWKLKKVF